MILKLPQVSRGLPRSPEATLATDSPWRATEESGPAQDRLRDIAISGQWVPKENQQSDSCLPNSSWCPDEVWIEAITLVIDHEAPDADSYDLEYYDGPEDLLEAALADLVTE